MGGGNFTSRRIVSDWLSNLHREVTRVFLICVDEAMNSLRVRFSYFSYFFRTFPLRHSMWQVWVRSDYSQGSAEFRNFASCCRICAVSVTIQSESFNWLLFVQITSDVARVTVSHRSHTSQYRQKHSPTFIRGWDMKFICANGLYISRMNSASLSSSFSLFFSCCSQQLNISNCVRHTSTFSCVASAVRIIEWNLFDEGKIGRRKFSVKEKFTPLTRVSLDRKRDRLYISYINYAFARNRPQRRERFASAALFKMPGNKTVHMFPRKQIYARAPLQIHAPFLPFCFFFCK